MSAGTYSYKIKAGDTLSKIAATFSTTVDKIAKDNNISNPNIIHVGDLLTIKVESNSTPIESSDDKLKTAINKCISAIENLSEYKELKKLL